ncbi:MULTISPECIES: DNA polymerase III subunit epsilon [unclassified Methylobacterium]|uniref:DNA polymerase III subunit epsilon n=1 Tax=unclassified Methylobacterium TaxID=2615210 RepID=UPI0011C20649|nr:MULTISPECIES: DNA polymerase III subunit epsilon [unclassified Methylobacterium]QEE41325.1 DNA polymerase III subunit epsilon [Methylobacterium sp. WL1]TXN57755.1 DNA polymerase III subunit epsilon [Methylobacterium sp. WL2]
MTREIVLDTETTSTDPKVERIIEVGCVELINHMQTGRTFHRYCNPQRAVHPDAFAVHGLSDGFLADKPLFATIVPELLAFIGDGTLIIHNAPFDVGFLNAEYARLPEPRPPAIKLDDVVDTLLLARRKHAGAANNLDALCNRYGIDRSRRAKHGALLDAQILAEVYVELLGGKQTGFDLAPALATLAQSTADAGRPVAPRVFKSRLTDAERERHAAFIGTLKTPVWADYISETDS